MIKRVVCLILLVLTFVMIPTNIGASSQPLPSGRLTGEELAMEYAQEGQISVERAKIILSIGLSDSKARTYRILSEKIIVNPVYQREGGRMLEVIYDFMDDTSTGFPVFLETKLRF